MSHYETLIRDNLESAFADGAGALAACRAGRARKGSRFPPLARPALSHLRTYAWGARGRPVPAAS